MDLLSEGKTKKIWTDSVMGKNNVLIESKDDITAGNGVRHDIIEKKGIFCNTITCNMFQLLDKEDIPNHFLAEHDCRSFLARRLEMISLEVVIRRIATGSYPKRAGVKPETRFEDPKIEFFFKCDEFSQKESCDPLIEYSDDREDFVLYDAHKPRKEGFLGMLDRVLSCNNLKRDDFVLIKPEKIPLISAMALGAFLCIEKAWNNVNVVIPDVKIEFGYDPDGIILIGDVIDNDSWRARLYRGLEWDEMSKQFYRNLVIVTPEALEKVRQKYEKMAELSAKLA